MSSYLVTGVARGLGLEIVRILSSQPANEVSKVFATIRSSPPPVLQEIVDKSDGRLIILNLEVTNLDSIAAAVDEVKKHVGNQGLDILINNVAINKDFPDGILTMDNLREMFEVNVEAVHNLTKAFVPLLREGRRKTVLNM
jgi:NAD(P)-dependent dehydrogenase (short-subunit alcohol dehydrogenase family)